ncbi:hypothetical protein M427DRAFT_157211, partial [Gonapodya prolifera JEL478]
MASANGGPLWKKPPNPIRKPGTQDVVPSPFYRGLGKPRGTSVGGHNDSTVDRADVPNHHLQPLSIFPPTLGHTRTSESSVIKPLTGDESALRPPTRRGRNGLPPGLGESAEDPIEVDLDDGPTSKFNVAPPRKKKVAQMKAKDGSIIPTNAPPKPFLLPLGRAFVGNKELDGDELTLVVNRDGSVVIRYNNNKLVAIENVNSLETCSAEPSMIVLTTTRPLGPAFTSHYVPHGAGMVTPKSQILLTAKSSEEAGAFFAQLQELDNWRNKYKELSKTPVRLDELCNTLKSLENISRATVKDVWSPEPGHYNSYADMEDSMSKPKQGARTSSKRRKMFESDDDDYEPSFGPAQGASSSDNKRSSFARTTRSAAATTTAVITTPTVPKEPTKEILIFEKVVIHSDDLLRLQPGEFLNDSIIEFYLKWLIQNVPNNSGLNIKEDVYVFNSFFYQHMTSGQNTDKHAMHKRVAKWTSKVDIFSKKILVVPINEYLHWYCVVIINPGKILEGADVSPLQRSVPAQVHEDTESPKTVDDVVFHIDGSSDAEMDERDDTAGKAKEARAEKAEMPAAGSESEYFGDASQANLSDGSDELTSGATMHLHSSNRPERQSIERTDGNSVGTRQMSSRESSPDPITLPVSHTPSRAQNSQRGKPKSKQAAPRGGALDRFVDFGLDEEERQSGYIVAFDSLGSIHRESVLSTLQGYLEVEAVLKKQCVKSADVLKRILAKGVPVQLNHCDCGVSLLEYIEKILRDLNRYLGLLLYSHKQPRR